MIRRTACLVIVGCALAPLLAAVGIALAARLAGGGW